VTPASMPSFGGHSQAYRALIAILKMFGRA
jgi:hypothetical protein